MSHQEKVRALLREHAPALLRGNLQVDCDRFEQEDLCLDVVGITLNAPGLGNVFSSAAGSSLTPERATFELIEKAAVLAAEQRRHPPGYPAQCWRGNLSALADVEIPSARLFPRPNPESGWVLARSNGVAAHTDKKTARDSAALELIERDEFLRAWFGRVSPGPYTPPDLPIPKAVSSRYDVSFHVLGAHTVAVFGFSRRGDLPLFMGLGAAFRLQDAARKALDEAIQRMAFLWEVPLPTEPPSSPKPSIELHMDYYLWPGSHDGLRDWLQGASEDSPFQLPPCANESGEDIHLVEITPDPQAKYFVFKAVSDVRLPLAFGLGNPAVRARSDRRVDRKHWIHPIS